jgi:hypothetical protein
MRAWIIFASALVLPLTAAAAEHGSAPLVRIPSAAQA